MRRDREEVMKMHKGSSTVGTGPLMSGAKGTAKLTMKNATVGLNPLMSGGGKMKKGKGGSASTGVSKF